MRGLWSTSHTIRASKVLVASRAPKLSILHASSTQPRVRWISPAGPCWAGPCEPFEAGSGDSSHPGANHHPRRGPQHGLARGCFRVCEQATSAEGLNSALLPHQRNMTKPHRKRLRWLRITMRTLSIGALLSHETSISSRLDSGAEALELLTKDPFDCMVLDLRLPDIVRLLRCSRGSGTTERWNDVPVVVFTGKEMTPDEHSRLHAMARSVVVKGVNHRNAFSMRPRSFLPPGGQSNCRPTNNFCSSGCMLRTKTWSASRCWSLMNDVRNIFALSSVLERRGMKVLTASTGSRGHRNTRFHPPMWAICSDGHHDAGNGRIRNHAGDYAKNPDVPPAADHRADSEGDEGRPREVPGCGRFRLPCQPVNTEQTIVCIAHPGFTDKVYAHKGQGKHIDGRRSAGKS